MPSDKKKSQNGNKTETIKLTNDKAQNRFFEMYNKTDMPLERLIRVKDKEKTPTTSIRNERGHHY